MKLKYVNKDDQHAYYLDGKRAKGVTSVAKYPDNTYNLEQWAKRMVAIGLAMNPVYVDAVAAHFDDRDTLDKYVEKALVSAKAEHGSDRGTAVHRFTERHDLGEPILETPLSAYVVSSWKMALALADLEVLPEYVERIVVYPENRICGRLDRILRRRSDGRLFIGDVKGGARALQYPHAMACQLAMYANAPLIAGPVPDLGGETRQFDAMPDVDKEWGYIFHLPDSGEAAVAKVNIAAGWECVQQIILPTIDWRDRHDLCQPVATIGGGEPAPVTPTTVEQAPPTVDAGGGEPSPSLSATAATDTPTGDRRHALVERVKNLRPEWLEEMADKWPVGVPTFKQTPHHTDEQLNLIEKVLDGIDWAMPEGSEPEVPPVPDREPEPELPPAAVWVEPDSERLTEYDYETVKARFDDQSIDVQSLVQQWALEANAAGRNFSPRDKRTIRRAAILVAACHAADRIGDIEVIRAVIGWVADLEMQETFTTGAALGSLTIDHARRLAAFAEHFGTDIELIYTADGPTFRGDGLAALAA